VRERHVDRDPRDRQAGRSNLVTRQPASPGIRAPRLGV